MEKYYSHYSVLNREVIEHLSSVDAQSPVFLDFTFGAGGHTLALCELIPDSKVIAFDQDPEALANGQKLIKEKGFEDRVVIHHTNFANVRAVLDEFHPEAVGQVAGIIADLGVSSHHFDSAERGFSYRQEGDLDMRMNISDDSIRTAKELVNEEDAEFLEEIFKSYGEERYSRRIATEIVNQRLEKPIETTKDLENIIFHCYPKKDRFKKTHPATRVFQALRIAVNRELDVLEEVLHPAFEVLRPGGKLSVISFHSIEDRIVKFAFRKFARELKQGKILTKKPIIPSEDELEENRRSRSAKLRVIEKL